ncbi:MAG: class II fructose-bisphosphate aldolase [Actinomycetota bacterium]
MPLAELRPFLENSRRKKYALGCFNVFNVETLEAVIEGALNYNTPIVCAVYEPQFKYTDLESFSELVKDVAAKVHIPVILHLDHAEKLDTVIQAIRCGFTAVMYDGPPGAQFEEKVKKTRQVVEIAHSVGVTVEAELGYITRVGTDEGAMAQNLADPDLAREFVEATGIDILAPAIGSVHGMGSQEATLDLDTLKKIRERTDCYLSLHGGSGVDDSVIRQSIDIGINKASVYTRLSNNAVERIKGSLGKASELSQVMAAARDGFREMVEDRLQALRSRDICNFQTNVCTVCSSKYCSAVNLEEKKTEAESSDYGQLVEKITREVLNNIKKR